MDKYTEKIEEIKEFVSKYHFKIILVLGLLVLALSGSAFVNYQTNNSSSHDELKSSASSYKIEDKQSSLDDDRIFVDVKGAVNKPGVYQVGKDMRVNDVIEIAGGFNDSADVKHLNLAQKVSDQGVIYVPIKGEIKGPPTGLKQSESSDHGTSGNDSGKTNINTADKTKLQTLTGIGDKTVASLKSSISV